MRQQWASNLAGDNFWKGSRYFREGEEGALEGEEEQLAKLAISTYAEAIKAAEECKNIVTSGEHLQPEFEKVLSLSSSHLPRS